MAEIGFYHLTQATIEQALPQLLERIISQDMKVVILTSQSRVQPLNSTLWEYGKTSFLPHGTAKDPFPDKQPIYLTDVSDNPNKANVLVLLDNREPDWNDDAYISPFSRIVYMFNGNDDQQLHAARTHWKQYKEHGHDLVYWKQDPAKGWIKAA